MDIWSRRIVGWSMGDRIDARLADDALRMAIARRRAQLYTVMNLFLIIG